ncbi:MAG: tRNA epoxyqueuosine(34) reductase QueG [Alphaproteobacteria bacterium 64-11]|nr:tRNA epoxyqueuosine(34) reductase QueG [Alphaproteobacteria bacterium]OJU11046.1 MAG: tRNA epoxyqueuosine(34) reductase QueG [Alphaproteobacteria bacterium 64-11]
MPNSTSEIIKTEAKALGFDAARITGAAGVGAGGERLKAFLDAGHHGGMAWMADRAHWRADPTAMWPGAKSAILLGMNYGPDGDPLGVLARKDRGAISAYAQGDDYHDVVKKKLKVLGGFIHQRFGAEVKVFVDTAPVMEKPLAARAGIGWQGKHTNLVSRQFGSWLFLGSVFTTLELPADAPESDHCGNCRACLDVCPTDAFPAPYRLDARRCISYLTIEHKGPIPREFRAAMGNRIYGCDDCLAVCPWNKFAQLAREQKLQAREELKAPPLAELAALDDAGFRALFARSPVKRIGRDRFVRNVMIAVGNSGAMELIDCAKRALADPAPMVRGAAVWALSRLLPEKDFSALARQHCSESDPDVRAEWGVTP